MANSTFSSSSKTLKIGVLVLFVVVIVHTIGFSIPRWISLEMNVEVRNDVSEVAYHGGLWQHCACAAVKDSGGCLCFSRSNDPGWFKIVQAAETLGLIGLVLSLLLSASMLFHKQNRRRKIVNLFLVGVSGTLILIGVIWFGIESREPLKQLNRSALHVVDRYTGALSYAYIFCVVAAFLSIFVCTPIFLKDLYAHTQEPPETQVSYTAEGQVHVPMPGYAPSGQQQVAYASMPMQVHHGAPPPYQPFYQPDNSGIPHKS